MRRPEGRVVPSPGPIAGQAPMSWPWEAFIPGGSPYLGQAILGEPIRCSNVLSPDRRLS
jgi:hypothetical protein